jgi:Transcriptional regulators
MEDDNGLTKLPLVDVAYRKLKEDICLGRYVSGQRLIIRDLSESLGVSQTPIKEALNRLVSEGLVEALPGRGMQVKRFKKDDIDEILEVRLMCELYCINKTLNAIKENPLLMQKFTDNITEHEQIIDIMSFQNYNRHHELDEEFHMLIIQSSGNKRILQLYTDQKSHLYTFYMYARERSRRYRESIQEHKMIYEALLERNEAKAAEAIENHMFNIKLDIESM